MKYYGRKYKALWIIGYLIMLIAAGFLAWAFYDAIAVKIQTPDEIGWSLLGVLIVWIYSVFPLGISVILGIIGWALTAKSNGKGAKRYKLLTFLPILVAGISFLGIYLM